MVKIRNKQNWLGIVLAILVVLLSLTPQMQSFYMLPNMLKLAVGDEIGLNLNLPPYLLGKLELEVATDDNNVLNLAMDQRMDLKLLQSGKPPIAIGPGRADLKLKLFGLISLKTVNLDIVQQKKLIPGGHSIGILLKTEGVAITGFYPIKTKNNKEILPGKQSGLRVGDIIEQVEETTVNTDQELGELINELGKQDKPIQLKVRRNDNVLNIKVKPVLCKSTKKYRLGLFIKDSAAGVGTLTFYDPDTNIYGALGHIVTDGGSNKEIGHGQGRIVNAPIQGIQLARRGQPGEKIGIFEKEQDVFGDIQRNTNYGIFGNLDNHLHNEYFRQPIPVAIGQQIKPGRAEIFTVIKGDKIERFDIEILKVNPERLPNGKNLLINITDPRLLRQTGGIIQGMSGSPIIQDGYLVGAVTHVLVNEPRRGYGILAEWMLLETELDNSKRTA